MNIIFYSDDNRGKDILNDNDPMLAIISHDKKTAVVGLIDEAVEHYILLKKALNKTDIDNYFRIVFDSEGADWTFVCPTEYKNIRDKEKRIQNFYNDGVVIIREFLHELGLDIPIDIPKRYRRHFNYMSNKDF